MRIALLSNVNVDIIKSLLEDTDEVYTSPGYDAWYQDLLAEDSAFRAFAADVVVLLIDANAILDGASDSPSRDQALQAELQKIASSAQLLGNSCLLVSNIDIRKRTIAPYSARRQEQDLETAWSAGLSEAVKWLPRSCILDVKGIVESIGRLKFYDDKMWYSGSIPYSLQASRGIAGEIRRLAKAYVGKRKKCLAIDLDNTIWGGVIGEDGLDGIVLGFHKEGGRFRDIQKRIKEIKDTGVLLAVVSKNNEEDALNAIRNHPAMFLREDDFVHIFANWKPKAQNLAELAAKLNIGIDSIVFLDDNPVEREEMKAAYPEVATVGPGDGRSFIEADITAAFHEHFGTIALTEEDRNKTEQYVVEKKREELRSASVSLEDYLSRLGISVSIRDARPADVDRIAQLTQKTNQFNLTTRRYTVADIDAFRLDPSKRVYCVNTADKYGPNGLVLVAVLALDGSAATIDTYLMSCRVMGRMVEDVVLKVIENEMLEVGITTVFGEFIPTGKNAPAENFYQKMGYVRMGSGSGGAIRYRKELAAHQELPGFIAVERSK